MPALPPYLADKNSLNGEFVMCVEFLYDNSDDDPANWLYYRKAQWDVDLAVTIDQLGNPSAEVAVTFAGGKPIGDTDFPSDMQSASSQSQIILPNARRGLQSIFEFYDLESKPGRVLWVNPNHLGDAAVTERVFQILTGVPVRDHAVLNVTPYSFDPTTRMIPSEIITTEKWSGVAGVRARFLV